MLATVKKDKGKIEETIDQLDQYKKEALQKTWFQVNSYVQMSGPGINMIAISGPFSMTCFLETRPSWTHQRARR